MAKEYKIAWMIVEGKDGQSYWNRIGVAFVNADGSLNVKLNALPVGGEFQLRSPAPRQPDNDERFNRNAWGQNKSKSAQDTHEPPEGPGGGRPDDDDIPF